MTGPDHSLSYCNHRGRPNPAAAKYAATAARPANHSSPQTACQHMWPACATQEEYTAPHLPPPKRVPAHITRWRMESCGAPASPFNNKDCRASRHLPQTSSTALTQLPTAKERSFAQANNQAVEPAKLARHHPPPITPSALPNRAAAPQTLQHNCLPRHLHLPLPTPAQQPQHPHPPSPPTHS